MTNRTLIVIPAYNEAATIGDVLTGLAARVPDCDRLVVSDGSSDDTGRIVDGLGEKRLRLATNLGYGRALETGFLYALERGYAEIVTIDGDGQHRPEDVPTLLSRLRDSGADVVIGSRYSDGRPYGGPAGRRIGQRLLSWATALWTGHRIYDTTSGLRAMRAEACRALTRTAFLDFHIEAIVRLSLQGFRIVEVPITMRERTHGRSMHGLASAVRYPVETFTLTLVAALDTLVFRRRR